MLVGDLQFTGLSIDTHTRTDYQVSAKSRVQVPVKELTAFFKIVGCQVVLAEDIVYRNNY